MFSFRSASPLVFVLCLPLGMLILPAPHASSTSPPNQGAYGPPQESANSTSAATSLPTPVALTMSKPSDIDLIQFLSVEQIGVNPDETERLVRKDVDVTGDGRKDILFGGTTHSGRVPFLAILSQPSAYSPWQVLSYTDKDSRNWANVRVSVEEDRIVADFLTTGGGTGFLELVVWRRWIECDRTECVTVWEVPILRTWQTATGPLREISRGYQTTEVTQQEPDTIDVIVDHFSLENAPYDEAGDTLRIGTARTYWSVGPRSRQTFRRADEVFTLVVDEQIVPSIRIVQSFDEQTSATTLFVSDILSTQSEGDEAYRIAWSEFWGLPSPAEPSDPVWGAWHQKVDAAATDGFVSRYRVDEGAASWVAGVTSAINRPLCRLTVQTYRAHQFQLKTRTEVPCIGNFTRLDHADVDDDGDSELLLLTITPTSGDPATVQRLTIFAIEDDGVREFAVFEGALNGPDMAGVRWEQQPNGFRVFTGMPLVDLSCETDDWSCIRLDRQFETYVWNSDVQEFDLLSDEK